METGHIRIQIQTVNSISEAGFGYIFKYFDIDFPGGLLQPLLYWSINQMVPPSTSLF